MKKILIMLFLSLSSFFVISAFVQKASGNNNPIPTKYIFQEMQNADIGFDIKNDITELTSSLQDLQDGLSFSDDALTAIVNVGRSIFYIGRFIFKAIVHVLVASLNIIIFACRVLGLESMNYIRLTAQSNDAIGGQGRFPTGTASN